MSLFITPQDQERASMRFYLASIAYLVLSAFVAHGQNALPTGWRFNNGPEFPGASGELLVRKDLQAPRGSTGDLLALLGDFSQGGSYVAAYQRCSDNCFAAALGLSVKTGADRMAWRLRDSDGQTHQHFVDLIGNPQIWQRLVLPVAGSEKHHWGGANDGKLRLPLREIALVNHAHDHPGQQRTELIFTAPQLIAASEPCIDGEFVSEGLMTPALDGWRFSNGPEFPGATGAMSWQDDSLRVDGDLSGGGGYVAVYRGVSPARELVRIRFKIKTPAKGMDVRFVDNWRQTHQHYFPLSGDESVYQDIEQLVLGSPNHHWGGPNDGVLRGPINTICFSVHGHEFKDRKGYFQLRDLRLFSSDPQFQTPVSWSVSAPEELFRRPGDPRPISFTVTPQPDASELTYLYLDYAGAEIANGHASMAQDGSTISVPPPPGRGFAELNMESLGIRIGVHSDDAPPSVADEFFAVDSSFSWGGPPNDERLIRAYLRIMKENGIIWNRDRLAWRFIEPQKDEFDFGARYELYRRLAAEEGIKTLDTFHDTPKWLQEPSAPGSNPALANRYPLDLLRAGLSWAKILRHWPMIDALEVWNEPDIGFANYYPAEYIGAFTKAVSQQATAYGLPTQIVGGVFASPRENTTFYQQHIANGLLDDSDVISYHTYARVARLESMVAKLRELELAHAPQRAGIPHWITECGLPWLRGTPRALAPHDMISAVEISGKAVEFRALGIERYFAFEYKYYDENLKNFGMMDAYHTPMRSMSAYGHLARVLAHRDYIGDLRGSNAIRARAFANDHDILVFLYAGLPRERLGSFALPADLTVLSASGLDGRPLAVNNGQVSAEDGAAILILPLSARSAIDSATTAMPLYQLAKNYQPAPRAAKAVVFQPIMDMTTVDFSTYGYILPSIQSLPVRVRINNFSSEARQISPQWTAAAGMIFTPEQSGQISVAANSSADIGGVLRFTDEVTHNVYHFLELQDAQEQATPLVMAILPWLRESASVMPLTPEFTRLSPAQIAASDGWLDFSQPENWTVWELGSITANISAKFRALWDQQRLLLYVLVDDPEHVNEQTALESWRGDSVQFAIEQRAADALPSHRGSRERHWQEAVAALGKEGAVIYRHIGKPEGATQASKLQFHRLQNQQSLYIIEINAEEFALDLHRGSVLGFSLLVNSNSGKGRDGYLFWGKGIADQKSSARFNILQLK
jgi:hypothetical protein